jgi:Holliday junction resolvase-like predicted endonuclease
VKLDNIYFVEVKSKKVNSFNDIKDMSFRPENNLTLTKRRRILKAIKFYLNKNKIVESDINICVLAVIVFLEEKSKKAKVKIYENMPLY